jgi:hypothetical protein
MVHQKVPTHQLHIACGRDIAHQKPCAVVLSSILQRSMLSLLIDCHRQSNRERARKHIQVPDPNAIRNTFASHTTI